MSDRIILEQLEIECVIGIYDWERRTRQVVSIDFELEVDMTRASATDNIEDTVDYKSIAKEITTHVEQSRYYLIETMAGRVAEICLSHKGVRSATVKVSKPGAVRGSKNVAVQVTRPVTGHTVYMGVGGNIDPERNIREGLKLIRQRFDAVETSPVYRSPAWGVTEEQPDYLNLAVRAKTDKDLFAVRAELRWIEELLGRKRTLDKFAPRTLDIDLLLYDDLDITDEGGKLPHPQLFTQQFVYMPMRDLAPDLVAPGQTKPLKDVAPGYEDPKLAIKKVKIKGLD